MKQANDLKVINARVMHQGDFNYSEKVRTPRDEREERMHRAVRLGRTVFNTFE